MLSTAFPRAGRASRLASAAGALLIQGGIAVLFLYSMPKLEMPRDLARELTLILRPQPKPVTLPAAPSARGSPSPSKPVIQNTPQTAEPIVPAAPPPAISDLSNFGQALNGCAPETYNSLTLDQRGRCPRPGAGVAIQEAPNLSGMRPEATDEALWQEQWEESHWMPGLCGPGEETVVLCNMNQAIAEFERSEDVRWHLARDKATAFQEPKPP